MELLWVLTGGKIDCDGGEIKYYNLIEYDNLENNIKISNLSKGVYVSNPEKTGELIFQKIHSELNQGKKFLCKTDIFYNGSRLFTLGYYSKKNGDYKYTIISETKNKVLYNKLMGLLIDNCISELP